jgi:chromosomal replication initiator protein
LFGAVFELCATTSNGEEVTPRAARQPQLREIIAIVARHFGLPQKELKSSSRRQSIVTARAVAIYFARELAGASYDQIGRALGGRDHTTIMHNYRKIERDRVRDPAIQEAIELLTRVIRTQ